MTWDIVVVVVVGFVAGLVVARLAFSLEDFLYSRKETIDTQIARIEAVAKAMEAVEAGCRLASFHELFPNSCRVIEVDGDGRSVGRCWHYMADGHTCPRHGNTDLIPPKIEPANGRR